MQGTRYDCELSMPPCVLIHADYARGVWKLDSQPYRSTAMPQTIESVNLLQQYLSGVLDRADHHAGNVDQICLAIAGAVIWRKSGDLSVMSRDGDLKNVLWFIVGERRFAISYNHGEGRIEVREGTTRGNTLVSFDNATPIAEVKQFFQGL